MKILLVVGAMIVLAVSPAVAQRSLEQQQRLETLDESRQRHGAENWRLYQRRGYNAPLGGYPERLGDPAPPGTERPGYYNTQPSERSPFGQPWEGGGQRGNR